MNKKIDYVNKFLYPVAVDFTRTGLNICFGKEIVVFKGKVFSFKADGDIDCRLDLENHDAGNTNGIASNQTTIRAILKAKEDCTLNEYSYFDGEWECDEIVVNKTNLSGIGAFIRKGSASFLLSLDFPYSQINNEDNRVSIGCDPLDKIEKGKEYEPHTLTVAAVFLTGEKVGLFDRAEIEGFSEYVQSRMPVNFNGDRPIFTATCITNRMVDVRDGRIFYSMYDNPTLTLDPEQLKNEVRLCAELGIEYYQVFEGYFDWEEDGSSEKALKEIVELGKSLGVRVGDYITALELNCWHYNYHNRKVEDKDLLALNGNGDRYYLCYGNDKTVDMLFDTVVKSIERNGEEMICVDGNCAVPCLDSSHGHNPGSYYKHIRGLVKFFERMNQTSPYFMTWTNAGNWIEFMPKLLWYNQNVYLTDPHPRKYSSALNNLKYYGDCRREQMVTVHNKYFVPYTAFTNCEYYAFKHSRVSDDAFFEYSFLQGLAVTPNICLGELRTFIERTAYKQVPKHKAFIKKWLKFIRDNIDSWKFVYQLGDSPDAGANEAYSHINGNSGFICFVNQNESQNKFTFDLDWSIGLRGERGDRFILSEIYPEEKFIAEQSLPGPEYGEKITVSIPAYSVKIIKVQPYFDEDGIRLYGVNGKFEKQENGDFTAEIELEGGLKADCAVYSSSRDIGVVEVKTRPNVPKYYFPSSVSGLKIADGSARFTVNSPREYFNREINEWSVDGGTEKYKLSLKNSDFCGAYLHNFYKENQKMVLTVKVGGEKTGQKVVPLPKKNKNAVNLSQRRASVYTTVLDIPFMEYSTMVNEYGFDEILELVFSDSIAVKNLRAYIDGNSVEVFEYIYPPDPNMKSFYIEIYRYVKSGTKPELKLEVDWNGENVRENKEKENVEGAQVVG